MTALTIGAFSAIGNSPLIVPRADLSITGFNASAWGIFVGTVQLQRSFDQGSTWLPLTASGVGISTWTAPFSEKITEVESGVLYRLACTAWTSGTLNYRISQ